MNPTGLDAFSLSPSEGERAGVRGPLLAHAQNSSGSTKSARRFLSPGFLVPLFAACFLGISLLAVSRQSFWIDEICSAHFAAQPSPGAMWKDMLQRRWPELEAPLYMAFIWLWRHAFGDGEWILRAAGIPWFVLGATCFVASFRERTQQLCALLLVALSPFAWFYLNEARLYSMQLGLTLMLLGCLLRLRTNPQHEGSLGGGWLNLFCVSFVLLCMVSMLGVLWASAIVLALPLLFPVPTLKATVRSHQLLFASSFLALCACAGYYLWAHSLGTKASIIHGTDWKSLCFIPYEQLGFSGLGPGRTALREEGIQGLKPFLFLLVAYAGLLGLVLWAAVGELTQQRKLRTAILIALAISLPASLLAATGVLMHVRVLGRHFTPVVGAILLLLSFGAARLWNSGRWWARAGLGLFFGLCLASSLSLRFAPRHAKDDYRGAAALAKAALAHGQSVWWAADPLSCQHYQLPASTEPDDSGKAWILVSPQAGFQTASKPPDLVFLSKPDIYDGFGAIHEFLRNEGYVQFQSLAAFNIFHRAAQ